MDPRNYIGNCESKTCSDMPLTPMHEMLDKMTALAGEIRENARYIDSSMFPINGKCAEAYPTDDGCYNMHDAIRRIMNELAIAHETLVRIRSCL